MVLRIEWAVLVISNEISGKFKTKRTLLLSTRKINMKFLGRILRKDSLALIEHFECKRNRGRRRITYLMSLCKMTDRSGISRDSKRQIILRPKKNRKWWRTTKIVDVLKRHLT